MKKKLFFLCTLLTLGIASNVSDVNGFSTTENELHINENSLKSTFSNSGKKDVPLVYNPDNDLCYVKCVNCGKLNEMKDWESPYRPCTFCGLPVNKKETIYVNKTCVNCGKISTFKSTDSSSTTCPFCEDPVGIKTFRCINCHGEINYTTYNDINAFCPHCGKLANSRLWKCTSEGCEGVGVMSCDDDYNNPCPWCDEYPCFKKLCINCDYENEIYYNYNGEEATFSTGGKRIRGDKCLNCGKSFKKSSEYAVFETTLQYKQNGTNYPLKGCKVYLRSQSGTLTRYATSDEKGYVRFKLRNSEFSTAMIRLFLMASPQSEGISVLKENNYSSTGYSEYGDYIFTIFDITQSCFGNINNGVSNIIDADGNSNNAMAVLIGRDALIARKYAKDMLVGRGIALEDVRIIYPASNAPYDANACYFDFGATQNTIFIKSSWQYNTRTVLHEYGHHIQDHDGINTFDEVLYSGGHYGDENHIERFAINSLSRGRRLAWGEGWPNVFAEVAKNYYFNIPSYSVGSVLELNDSKRGVIRDHDSGTGNIIGVSNKYPDGVEKTNEQILWDMFDNVDSVGDVDYFGLGYKDWFDLTTTKNITTLEKLFFEFKRKYPSLESKMKDLLAQHDIYY